MISHPETTSNKIKKQTQKNNNNSIQHASGRIYNTRYVIFVLVRANRHYAIPQQIVYKVSLRHLDSSIDCALAESPFIYHITVQYHPEPNLYTFVPLCSLTCTRTRKRDIFNVKRKNKVYLVNNNLLFFQVGLTYREYITP